MNLIKPLINLLVSIDSNIGTTKLNLSDCLGRILVEDNFLIYILARYHCNMYAACSSEVSEGKNLSFASTSGFESDQFRKRHCCKNFYRFVPSEQIVSSQEDVKKIGDQKGAS